MQTINDENRFLSPLIFLDEIQFDCSFRIIRGDNFRPPLSNEASSLFRIKSDHYRRLVITFPILRDFFFKKVMCLVLIFFVFLLIIRYIAFIKPVHFPILFGVVLLNALPMAVCWSSTSSCFSIVGKFPRK